MTSRMTEVSAKASATASPIPTKFVRIYNKCQTSPMAVAERLIAAKDGPPLLTKS